MDSEMEEDKRVALYKCVRLQVILTAALVILATLTSFFIGLEKGQYHADDKLCLPCNKLGVLSNREVEGIPEKWTRDQGTCCAADRDLKQLVQLYVNHWYKNKLHRDNPTYQSCRHHDKPDSTTLKLVGARGNSHGKDHRLIHWTMPPDMAYGHGLSYHHGHIYIAVTGIYYVYSQIVFNNGISMQNGSGNAGRFPQGGRADIRFSKQETFIHTVVQTYRSDEKVVLQSSMTPEKCGGLETSGAKTSYLGSYLLLYEGDMVAVKVSSPTKIMYHSSMNFFGIHSA